MKDQNKEKLKVKIQLTNSKAKIPFKNDGDNCYDVVATSIRHTPKYIEYGLGFKTELPENVEAVIRPRSSISNKDVTLINSPGTIDSSYRGEWKLRFKLAAPNFLYFKLMGQEDPKYDPDIYEVGDKIAQVSFRISNDVEFEETEIEVDTERGSEGFGSTGK
jgi:dUTP pyrophosphatase